MRIFAVFTDSLYEQHFETRKHSSRMRTDHAVTRPSSEPVGMLNPTIASYRPGVSPNCTFCAKETETILHLYWECEHTKGIWKKGKTFVAENISEDANMSCYSCLLSDFDPWVLVLLSTIVKFRIFMVHLNNWKISYIQILKDLRWNRDTHLDRMEANNLNPYQWRIQDFPQGGRQLPKLLLFFTFLPKTA